MEPVNWPAVEQAVLKSLATHYDLGGRLERLSGENLNFLLRTNDARKFVVKVVEAGSLETAAEVENAVLSAARAGGFKAELPTIQKTNNTIYETGIELPINGVWKLRVLNFVHGTIVEKYTDISIELRKSAGRTIASFDRALQGFDHPALHRTHAWDLAAADRHRKRAGLIPTPARRALIEWAFDRWRVVRPLLPGLPQQVIHGDANPENLLADGERITGLVDLGDCLFTARACEPAIAIAYLMMHQDDPRAAARDVIDGYTEVVELAPAEREALLPLACGRLAVTVCMAVHRQTIDPANENWFVSLAPALRLLEQLRDSE